MKLSVSKNSDVVIQYESPKLDLDDNYEVFIGRSSDCHIFIDDNVISRYHAVLKYSNGAWSLEKLSKFGELLINGVGEEKKAIRQGDLIQIANYSIKVDELMEAPTEVTMTQTSSEFEDQIGDLEPDSIEGSEDLSDFDDDDSQGESSLPIVDDTEENSESDDHSDFDSDNTEEESNDESEDSNEEEEESLDFSDGDEGSFGGDDEGGDFGDDSEGGGFDQMDGEGFGAEEGGFGEDGFDDDSANSTQVFRGFANFSLRIDGEFAPFDRYNIEDNEIFIGRDPEKCQIVLDDPEVSGINSKISKTLISCEIEDKNSANGTIVNGERVNKKELENGDEIQIGSTIFTLEISSDAMSDEDMFMPVDDDQEIEVIEEVEEEVDFGDGEGFDEDFYETEEVEEKSLFKNPKKRKILIGVGILVAIVMVLPEGGKKKKRATGTKGKDGKVVQEVSKKKKPEVKRKKLTDAEKRSALMSYKLGKKYYSEGRYREAEFEFNKVSAIDPNYAPNDTGEANLQMLIQLTRESIAEIARKDEELAALAEKKARDKKIKKLVEDARKAVNGKDFLRAEVLFTEVMALDPENLEIPRLKLEVEAIQKQEEIKKIEEQRKKLARAKKVEQLKPGKNSYLKKEWHKAILRLEKFLEAKNMDEDLIKEATDMLVESKKQLKEKISPLLGKARSLKEGQDLKSAYEIYIEVISHDPGNEEALNEIQDIKFTLEGRSKKIYREALIAESLSLFKEAKEKFQEVQQISPTDSKYYKKASKRLREYLE